MKSTAQRGGGGHASCSDALSPPFMVAPLPFHRLSWLQRRAEGAVSGGRRTFGALGVLQGILVVGRALQALVRRNGRVAARAERGDGLGAHFITIRGD